MRSGRLNRRVIWWRGFDFLIGGFADVRIGWECSVKCVKINLKLQKQLQPQPQPQPQSLKTKTCNRLIFRLLKNFFYVKEKFEIARLPYLRQEIRRTGF